MTIEKVKVEMTIINERVYEGCHVVATVNTETDELISVEFEDEDIRNWTESQGAPGTADHFLKEMTNYIKDDIEDGSVDDFMADQGY